MTANTTAENDDNDTSQSSNRLTLVAPIERKSWFWRIMSYSGGAGLCLICQFYAANALFSTLWLLSLGYGIVLLGVTMRRSRQIVGLFGLAGGYWLAVNYLWSSTAALKAVIGGLVLLWVPAGLAGGIWLLRWKHTKRTNRANRTNHPSGRFENWNN